MSFPEIKAEIARLTVDQRLEVAALITHLNRAEDPVWMAELDRRLDAMEGGRGLTKEDLEKRHRELSSQGR